MAQVAFRHVEKVYENGFHAVHDLNLEIADGEFLVLVGPSGCGKSTALRMIAGLEDVSGGDLVIGEKRVNELPPQDRDIAMVFQSYALYPHMSVADNIAYGLKLRKMPKQEIEDRIKRAADMLELTANLDRKPAQLSGGQRQRVAIARAMAVKPQIVLADEPTANLDSKTGESIIELMKRINRELDTTFIFSTHDAAIMTIADHIIRLQDGLIVENVRKDGRPHTREVGSAALKGEE